MSVPALSEKYSPAIYANPVASPKSGFCRAMAPGTLIRAGMSSLAIFMILFLQFAFCDGEKRRLA